MAKFKYKIIGILVGAKASNYRLYHYGETWAPRNHNDRKQLFPTETYSECIATSETEVVEYLKKEPFETNTFVNVFFEVTCPHKENKIKKIVKLLPPDQSKLDLISIDQEKGLLNGAHISESGGLEHLIRNYNYQHLSAITDTILSTYASNPEIYAEKFNTNMMILGGFIAALGIAAVAIAFTVLNAATLGVAGLVVASLGAATVLTGLGFFAAGARKNNDEEIEINYSNCLVAN